MGKQVGMISLGCSKNQVDGEVLLATLRDAGFCITNDLTQCDAVIVNTCGFVESAKKESIDEILNMVDLKKNGSLKAIVVTGCLAERYQSEIQREMPEVDAVVGIGGNPQIACVLEKALRGQPASVFPEKLALPISGKRIQSTPKHYAYLKVSEGCDNRCSYCAIPLIRGKFRSRPLDDVVEEAKALAANGVRELIVIAQDTTRYGEDLYGKLMLPTLLNRLCELEGIHWIRVLYCYPNRITDELLDVMAKQDKVLNYIDLPLQHCAKNVLQRMNRGGSTEQLMALIQKMREKVPGLILRTTFICGFPGETEEEFQELAQFSKAIRFDRLGCFPYSQEEDTPAADFPDQIDEEEKMRRVDILMENQMQIMQELSDALLGQTLEILVDGFDEDSGMYYGRSRADSPDVDGCVLFTATEPVETGEFVWVKITECIGCDLCGELVQKEAET
ncbi:MAG: 30S ribosomal protein S12 methylthiotransferase RimO [Oscillospiraceae bacterium]|nr:30S ribosomal protein S12 methylthiotransferase RimO [Oscillospiraceae bacterium]